MKMFGFRTIIIVWNRNTKKFGFQRSTVLYIVQISDKFIQNVPEIQTSVRISDITQKVLKSKLKFQFLDNLWVWNWTHTILIWISDLFLQNLGSQRAQ